jgi:hypothetical protein
MNKPLALTDAQLREIKAAAATLPSSHRSEFLESIARRLGHEPTDEAVAAAIAAQLSINRLPVFLCDSAPAQSKQTIKGTTINEPRSNTADSPFGPDGLLKDGYTYKMSRIAIRAPALTLTPNAPVTDIRSK